MEQIRCDNLTLKYGVKTLFENLTFSVNQGDYLCIVGENGSGKTTLMKSLLGMKAPAVGSISFAQSLQTTEIGYLPQQTEVQRDFPASVWEIVLSGCQNRKGHRPWYNRKEKELARENIHKMEIDYICQRCYSELSGGQQQRVLLARALCATQKILLLDEPVTGLDPKATEEMYRLVENLNKEGVTIIKISHDVEAAIKYASHILFMGEEHFYGTKAEYLNYVNKRLNKGEVWQ